MMVNNELERVWNKAAVAQFKMQSPHLPGGLDEMHGKQQSN
jgi:hypothetical protein